MQNPTQTCIVLDAMGVIYTVKDDVADLLVPFINKHAGAEHLVEEAYREASLGQITADEFWTRIGLSPNLEEDYLATLTLTPGVEHFLETAMAEGFTISALTNDVGRWSKKLRKDFNLEKWIPTWIVSSDTGYRKPSPQIYDQLSQCHPDTSANDFLFVDDRIKNLDTARQQGWQTILFRPEADTPNHPHQTAAGFDSLWKLIDSIPVKYPHETSNN